MDFAHTKKFLHYLDPDANEFTFQTYGEGQASNKYFLNSTFSNAFEDVKHHLLKLNGNGAGISVTVNETDGSGKRTIHNIVRVRAVWQDDDSGYEGDYPLEPSMEVESSPGRFHRYWIIDPSDPLSPSDFIKVMKVMVDQYGSDPNCKDLSRVLRLPGSYHMKTGYPFLVSLVGGNGRRYKGHEIKEAFLQQEAASSQQATFASSGELPLIPIEAPKPKPIEIEDTFTERELSKADLKKLKEALEFIPPESRGTWLEVGFALFDAFQGREKGFDIWDKWSQGTRAKNYNGAHQMRSWYGEFHKRTGRENRVGLGTIYRLAMENGWEPKESYETEPEFKYEKVKAAPGELTNKTMGALRKSFVEYGHYPSQPQLVGLNDLVNHLESMANGTAEKHFFLSSLDPGVGKTQSISHFTKKLLESKAHDSVAILFCLGRLSEIRNIVTDMGLEEDQYAVFVTDIEANRDLLDMGNQDPSKARVLFTTQQMLESRIKRTGSFEQAKDFHYLGKPRQVRLWDEACLPARPFTVNLYGIKKLLEEANKRYEIPALHDTLKKLANELEQQEDGSIFDIPALDEIVPQNRALSIYREESPATRNLVRDLWLLSGKSVYIRKQGNENVIAHYENTLPDDLKPIVICDASGRVRKTYKHWSDGRDDLIALQYGPKSYKPLTIH